jgi:hypothetical protein
MPAVCRKIVKGSFAIQFQENGPGKGPCTYFPLLTQAKSSGRLADVLVVRGDVRDLPLAVPNLNSAAVQQLPGLSASRLIVRTADEAWLPSYLVCLVYLEKAVLDHFGAFESS